MKAPSVYDYLDYRAFLNDMFNHMKVVNEHFSYRFFSRKAGFASPNFLKLVISEQRNLTNDSVAKVAKGFGLTKKEREFFEDLVFMNQASNHEERNYYYKKMMSGKVDTQARRLEKASYNYFSKWYYLVIRELILFGDHVYTAEQIAGMCDPPITPKEAQKALDFLQELDLIYKDDTGRWAQKDKAVTTGPEVQSMIIANYHREMLKLAGESIERHRADQRDITALTLSINRSMIPDLKKRIAAFRKELLDIACNTEEIDQVVQVNFQLFPLAAEVKEEAGK